MSDEIKIALERYRNVLGYLQYENSIYWTRSSFIMIAQAAMIGFSFRLFPIQGSPSGTQLLIIFFVGILGLAFCSIWKKMITSSLFWINRWIDILKNIEPVAYGEIEVFRGIEPIFDEKAKVHSLRKAADNVRMLFIIVWLLFLSYSLTFFFLKLCSKV